MIGPFTAQYDQLVSTKYRGPAAGKKLSTLMQQYKPASVIKQHNDRIKLSQLIERHVQHGRGKPVGVVKRYETQNEPSDPILYGQHARKQSTGGTLYTPNMSVISTNYSFRAQLAKQIEKAKKYQPNVSLSKLIDLNEY